MSCGVDSKQGSDPTLLWLWPRPVATAPIRPWEPPYATGAVLEKTKKKKEKVGCRHHDALSLAISAGKSNLSFLSTILRHLTVVSIT